MEEQTNKDNSEVGQDIKRWVVGRVVVHARTHCRVTAVPRTHPSSERENEEQPQQPIIGGGDVEVGRRLLGESDPQ